MPSNLGRPADCPSSYTNNGLTCGRSADTISAPSLVATCPSGYTNNGLTCGRAADTISAPSLVANCPSGYTNNGLTCGRGADTISAPSLVANCPSGYTNMGLTCFRPVSTYGKGCTTIFHTYSCAPGYTDMGCFCARGADSVGTGSMSCPSGYFLNGSLGRCYVNCPSGYTNTGETCFRPASTLGTSSMSCPSGYFLNSSLGRCYRNCPSGYTNTGETCFKPASTLGSSSMTCPSGYFLNGNLGRCYKNCPSGYTNTGETCFKPASTLGIDSMTCRAGEFKSGVRCYDISTCTGDREFWGGLCYTKCPGSSTRTAVSTCVHQIRWRGNTHLFIVNRALELLSKSTDPVAIKAVAAMNDPSCRDSWEDGLWNADDGALADRPGPGGGAAGSHFYDGAGKDENGAATSVVTYMYFGTEQNEHGNARTNAKDRIDGFREEFAQDATKCENLGIALHYLTDMTQPMHATTFSGGSVPLMLHPVLEEYVPSLQADFPQPAAWDQRGIQSSADDVFFATSTGSAALAPELMRVLQYDGTLCTMTPESGITYTGYCFLDVPSVNSQLATVVTDGYQATASYIYAVFNEVP